MEFGCLLSSFDARDYKIASTANTLPDEFILPLNMPVKNQKQVSSCVAHAVSSILEYHTNATEQLSTNFIYGIQKHLFNREGKGMMLRDACKIAADYGDMLLADCPGNTEVPTCYATAENALADTEKAARAKEYRIVKYFSCSTTQDIKQALHDYGPVLASIRWYNTYKVAKDGTLTVDESGSYSYHAIVIYGYTPDGFWCQNSWGTSWGKKGRFFLPNSVKVREARGFVDWDGNDDNLKEPTTTGFWNWIYKAFNTVVNLFYKWFSK